MTDPSDSHSVSGRSSNIDELLDVLDLVQLCQRPASHDLLQTLDALSLEHSSWHLGVCSRQNGPTSTAISQRGFDSKGLAAYLTKIIASPLAWIIDDAEKEKVWVAASQRLSERSGRTAMGNLTRKFSIPIPTIDSNINADAYRQRKTTSGTSLELSIHEPALTADNLGHKTWASSYLLATRLPLLRAQLPRLPPGSQILELGAGTGLVGLTAAATWQATVVPTDLPAILPNLHRNIAANAAALSPRGARATAAVLDWTHPQSLHLSHPPRSGAPHPARSFPLVLAADCIYSPEHPRLVTQALSQHLSRDAAARVVAALPRRDADAAARAEFVARMHALGLAVVQQGVESGVDDWREGGKGRCAHETLVEVRCWWSVWGWR